MMADGIVTPALVVAALALSVQALKAVFDVVVALLSHRDRQREREMSILSRKLEILDNSPYAEAVIKSKKRMLIAKHLAHEPDMIDEDGSSDA